MAWSFSCKDISSEFICCILVIVCKFWYFHSCESALFWHSWHNNSRQRALKWGVWISSSCKTQNLVIIPFLKLCWVQCYIVSALAEQSSHHYCHNYQRRNNKSHRQLLSQLLPRPGAWPENVSFLLFLCVHRFYICQYHSGMAAFWWNLSKLNIMSLYCNSYN